MIQNVRCIGANGNVIVPGRFVFSWKNEGFEQQSCVLTVVGGGETKTFTKTGAERRILADLSSLKAGETYRYFIETFDKEGSVKSEEKTLYVTDENFHGAKWISNGWHYVELERKLGSPSITMRKIFAVDETDGPNILKICGVGFFTAYLNGNKLGDGVLEPPFTAYDKRVIFRAYEVSDFLKKGENVLEVCLGDGWYNQTTIDTWGFYRATWRDNAKMVACMTGKNGFVSDTDWQWSFNRITSNALRAGETLDCTVGEGIFFLTVIEHLLIYRVINTAADYTENTDRNTESNVSYSATYYLHSEAHSRAKNER